MTPQDLVARIRRYERLTLDLMAEDFDWRSCDAPVLRAERVAFRAALRQALAGSESARVVLARAARRIAEESGEISAKPRTVRG